MNAACILHERLVELLHIEQRVDPFFRPAFDAVLREPLAALAQALINARRVAGTDPRAGAAQLGPDLVDRV